MKRLIIRELGPLKEADITLTELNLIIGMQGSGKSCILKTACHCAWVEKRIFLSQTAQFFSRGTTFIDSLSNYFRLKGLIRENTYISYETPYMAFSYDNATRSFTHTWKDRWQYARPKVSYIPADRNLVAVIPNWSKLPLDNDNVLDFMSDWDRARRYTGTPHSMLNLGISYSYDSETGADYLFQAGAPVIPLTCGSSGLQSLAPIVVHLDYICDGIYNDKDNASRRSLGEKIEEQRLFDTLYRMNFAADSGAFPVPLSYDGKQYTFPSEKGMTDFMDNVCTYTRPTHAEIFLEEPEDNLFPPTQVQLVDYLLEKLSDSTHKHSMFVATHSPYILNRLMETREDGFNLHFTHPAGDGLYRVKTASKEEVQEIYDSSLDMFFNFEAFTD